MDERCPTCGQPLPPPVPGLPVLPYKCIVDGGCPHPAHCRREFPNKCPIKAQKDHTLT